MGRTTRRDKNYYKYKAPEYRKTYIKTKKSIGQPIPREPEKGASGYWVDTYHITYHALQRYMERFLEIDNVDVEDLTHKEKVKLIKDLTALLPKNFHKITIPMKFVLSNGCKAIINDKGVVVTIMKKNLT